jgi:hypothetical protein
MGSTSQHCYHILLVINNSLALSHTPEEGTIQMAWAIWYHWVVTLVLHPPEQPSAFLHVDGLYVNEQINEQPAFQYFRLSFSLFITPQKKSTYLLQTIPQISGLKQQLVYLLALLWLISLGWMQRGCSVGLWKGHLHGYSQTVT